MSENARVKRHKAPQHWVCLLLLLLSMCTWNQLAQADQDEAMQQRYQRAIQAFQRNHMTKALRLFHRVLPYLERLQRTKAAGSQSAHLAILGQCDILYHLAEISIQRKQWPAACRRLDQLQRRLARVPQGWQRWGVQPNLPGRLAKARLRFARCQSLPTQVTIQTNPNHAKLFQRRAGSWQPLTERTLQIRTKTLHIKAMATGYKTTTKRWTLKRWQMQRLTISLHKQSITPLPTTPTPIYKQWWLWTTVGIVAAGAITATVLVVTAKPRETLVGPSGESYPIFTPK